MDTARSRTLRVVGNVVAFQLGWFGCVLAAARGHDAAGVGIVAAIVLLHLWLAARPSRELCVVVAAVLIGAVWDSLLRKLGLLVYAAPGPAWLAPAWILAMWALFGTTLNVSLRWLRGRLLVAVLFGGIGGPMAFWAGQRLGAVQIPGPWPGLLAQAAGWAMILPVLLQLARRLDTQHDHGPRGDAHV